MPITVQCPNPACGVNSLVGESISGKNVRCKKCGQPFVAKPTFDGQRVDTKANRPSGDSKLFPTLPAEFGRYRVLKLLGKGGMGAVYLAEDSHLDREVALKMPFFDDTESPKRIERFVREARSAAALHHPNICTVFDAGQIDGRPFLTMAYIPGKSLEDEIDPDQPMSQVRAAELVRKIALALDHAHSKGTVHRDLKPANVMIAADGEPIVMDFGLAKRFTDVDPKEAKLTRVGGIVGTPSYMSPEQVKGDPIGPSTDIYALGVMLFELLTGKTPYCGSMGIIMAQIITAPVPPPKEFRQEIDSRLDSICRKAMAKEPSDRFTSMGEFANAIGSYLKSPAPMPPPLPPSRLLTGIQVPRKIDDNPFDQLVDATARKPRTSGPKSKPFPIGRTAVWVCALAIVGFLGVLLTLVVFRIETPRGTLVVELTGDDVEARIKNGTLLLSGPDGKVRYVLSPNDRQTKLDAGLYKVRVEGADGLVLDTPEFTLKKDGSVTVRVTAVPTIVAMKDASSSEKGPQKQSPNSTENKLANAKSILQDRTLWEGPNRQYWFRKKEDGAWAEGAESEEFPFPFLETGRNADYVDLYDTPRQIGIRLFADHCDIKRDNRGDDWVRYRNGSWNQGFKSLFNGKDLSGWYVERDDPKSWEVENGVIVARGSTLDKLNFLLSDGEYGNFILRFEFSLGDHAGSGVVLRGVPNEVLPHPLGERLKEHPMLRLEDQPTRSEVTGTLHWVLDKTHVQPKNKAELSEPDGWNKMEIEMIGRRIRAVVNGKEIVDNSLAADAVLSDGAIPGLIRTKGRIGFVKHHGIARFRDIVIKELPADNP